MTRMALSREHTPEAADPAKLSLSNKRQLKHTRFFLLTYLHSIVGYDSAPTSKPTVMKSHVMGYRSAPA